MSDPSSILDRAALLGEIGDYLGWGRGPDNGEEEWDANKVRALDSIVASGQRRVYTQAQLEPPTGPIHQWTFLSPSATATLDQAARYAELPDDFGYLVGEVSVTSSGTVGYCPVRLENTDRVRRLFALNDATTGRPQVIALDEQRGTSAGASSRGRFYVYPSADTAYTLAFSYSVLPSLITTARPFPYGGAAHAETFKAACRAAAELYLDNRPGPEEQNYRVCLAASVAYDRRRQPQLMAYNADLSDTLDDGRWRRGVYPWNHLDLPTSTIGGLDPG